MAALRYLLLLLLSMSLCLAHTMPGRKEDAHYKNGKHNDAYDHETFLGEDGQKEFGELEDKERIVKLSKLVDKIDKNGDNNVSSSELTDWIKYISLKEPTEMARKIWGIDYALMADSDGLLSREAFIKINFPATNYDEEMEARKQRYLNRFIAADENNDDKMSFDEFVAYQHLALFPRMHDVFVKELLDRMDLDKDGSISVEEFRKDGKKPREQMEKEFNKRDLDKSGLMEKNEVKEWYFPTTYDPHENEAHHIIRKADTRGSEDGILSRKEILDNFKVFVGSRATNWGKTLNRPVDEL